MEDEDILNLELRGIRYVCIDKLHEIPIIFNKILIAFVILGYIYQLYLIPYLLTISYWTLVFLPFSLLAIISGGILVHEAIHNLLIVNQKLNKFFGRILGIFMGVAFDLQKYDHLQHHRYNSTIKNCPDVKIGEFNNIKYLQHLYYSTIGLFISEFFFNIFTVFCSLRKIKEKRCYNPKKSNVETSGQIAMKQLIENNKIRTIRIDGIFIILINVLSIYIYYDILWLFIILFIIRAFILTILDSFAHFKTPVNARWFAKNIFLPKLVEKYIFLNFNLHGVHHIFPDQSWVKLSSLMHNNNLKIKFQYHQSLLQAIKEKLEKPKYVKIFPTGIKKFNDIV